MRNKLTLLALTMATAVCAQTTMTLRECINYAKAHNITIKQNENTAEQQRTELSTIRNSRLPDLTASASEQINFGRGLNEQNAYVNRNTRNTAFSLQTSVPLFSGGRIPNEIAASRLNLAAAVADIEHARENISLQVTSAYLQAVYTHEVIGVDSNQVMLSKAQEERLSRMLLAGKVAETDVAEARAQVAQDELTQTQAQADFRLAILDLSQLLELPSPEGLGVVAPKDSMPATLPPTPDAIFAQAKENKPEVKAEKVTSPSLRAKHKRNKSRLLPHPLVRSGIVLRLL